MTWGHREILVILGLMALLVRKDHKDPWDHRDQMVRVHKDHKDQ